MTNREFFAQCCASERDRFVGVLEALPADKLDWRPEPKARTAGELIQHLIGHEQDLVELLDTGVIHHRMHVPIDDHAHGVELFARSRDEVVSKVNAIDDVTWESPGRFLVDGNVVYELPRFQLAWILLFDSIHHRGQLSTYLRPCGGKVPAIYGPSADTPVEH